MSEKPQILSPREPLVDANGIVTRSWWRFLNGLFTNSGSLATPLTVEGSALLTAATITSGGTISTPDIAASTVIGNPNTVAALPSAIPIGTSLVMTGGTLAVAPLAAGTLAGNPGSSAAAPSAITVGTNLTLSGGVLSATTTGSDNENLLYSIRDPRGQLAALERGQAEMRTLVMLRPNRGSVTSIATGTGLTGGTITDNGTISFAAIADKNLLANTSGGSAAPVATTVTALLDAALGNVQGDVLYRSGSIWTVLAPGSSGNVLTSGGPAADPSWTAPTTGTVTSVATGTGLTGGTITTTGTISFAAIASNNILANITGGSAAPIANTLTATIDAAIGSTQGDILYRGASTWSVLAPGTTGQFLQTKGASANPAWDTVADVGRNKLHNSLFRVQQRGAGPFTTTAYTLDQWNLQVVLDSASVTGVSLNDTDRSQIGDEEAVNGLQNAFTGNNGATAFNVLQQRIENVYRLANTTITVSLWAKAASGTPSLGINLNQNFGTGGSTVVAVAGQAVTLSTTWARYSVSITVPSASGKTVGAGNFSALGLWFSSGSNNATTAGIGVQSGTFTIWGVQLEIGNLTPLEKLEIRSDVANCQRYYQIGTMEFIMYGLAANSTGQMINWPVVMRAVPTLTSNITTTTNTTGATVAALSNNGFLLSGLATATAVCVVAGTYTASAEL